MRLNVVVLVAVIALVSRCSAVSTASRTSQIRNSNLNQALGTTQDHADEGKRFLRSAKFVDDMDSEDDIVGSDEDYVDSYDEERGGKTWAQKFAKWEARGESAEDVYQRFALEPIVREAYKYGRIADLDNNEYYRKWAAYAAYLKDKGKN